MGASKAREFPSVDRTHAPALSCRRFFLTAVLLLATAVAGEAMPLRLGSPSHAAPALTQTDTALLDEMERRAVMFFVDQSDPHTGLTRDRAPNHLHAAHAPASTAATGFALSAWCIADDRGWLADGEAIRRVRTTLQFAAYLLPNEHGWFYHFVDPSTGRRAPYSEVSTIDTALFLQGAIFAREYFGDPEINALVDRIYRRIDWQWARNGGASLSMGWKPETGFLAARWNSYSELMGLYLLGMGAPAHGLPAAAWEAWLRPQVTIAGRTFIDCGPLFTHQYAHAWFDFRGVHDRHADYWRNSVNATLAQRTWSAAQQTRYSHWSANLWGLTASDGPHGYMAWGTPAYGDDYSDGTVVPCAPGGSLPFAPRECLTALHQMRTTGGAAVWGRYGFADAFNPQTGWVSPDVIGIDLGITLVMAENLRSGLVWNTFMRAPEVQRGMQAAGFVSTRAQLTENLAAATHAFPLDPVQSSHRARRENFRIYIDRDTKRRTSAARG